MISFDNKKKNYQAWAKIITATTLRGYNIVLMEANPKSTQAEQSTESYRKGFIKTM